MRESWSEGEEGPLVALVALAESTVTVITVITCTMQRRPECRRILWRRS